MTRSGHLGLFIGAQVDAGGLLKEPGGDPRSNFRNPIVQCVGWRSGAVWLDSDLEYARIVTDSKLAYTIFRHPSAPPKVNDPPHIGVTLKHSKPSKTIEVAPERNVILSQPFGQLEHAVSIGFDAIADIRGK